GSKPAAGLALPLDSQESRRQSAWSVSPMQPLLALPTLANKNVRCWSGRTNSSLFRRQSEPDSWKEESRRNSRPPTHRLHKGMLPQGIASAHALWTRLENAGSRFHAGAEQRKR